jgi:hypothetical protein
VHALYVRFFGVSQLVSSLRHAGPDRVENLANTIHAYTHTYVSFSQTYSAFEGISELVSSLRHADPDRAENLTNAIHAYTHTYVSHVHTHTYSAFVGISELVSSLRHAGPDRAENLVKRLSDTCLDAAHCTQLVQVCAPVL